MNELPGEGARILKERMRFLEESELRGNELLAKEVGREAMELLASHPKPTELLESPSPNIRLAVLGQPLRREWITQEAADRCEALALTDSDHRVRSLAVTCLSHFYRRKNNPRIGALLARIVSDTSEHIDVRRPAYTGLSSMPDPIDLSHFAHDPGFSFPRDVDWAWVKSFLINE